MLIHLKAMDEKISEKKKMKIIAVRDEAPKINIGKNGLTENILNEIDRQLNEHEVVKIKFLRSMPLIDEIDIKDLGRKISSTLSAEIIDIRGKTITLYRKQRIYKR